MIVQFNALNQFDAPTFILANPDKSELYALGSIFDRKFSPRYNALSEISFTAPSHLWVNPLTAQIEGFQFSAFQEAGFQVENIDEVTLTETEYYDFLVSKRLIFIPDIGYFIITEVEEENDGITNVKHIVAKSLEVGLVYKKISNFSGTFNFYNSVSPDDTLLGRILTYLPGWTIGEIDTELCTLYRTFDISDSTIYNFLMNDVEEAYQCIFNFDYNLQTISAYTVAGATTSSDIFLSFDNLIERTSVSEIADELVTALNVYGRGDLSINQINPLGNDTLYDFSYFKTTSWMSQDLIDAITAWEDVVDANQSAYADELAILLDLNETLIAQTAALVDLQSELAAFNIVKSAQIQQGLDLTAINAQIVAKEAEITSQNLLITNTNISIVLATGVLTAINTTVSFASNFTTDELEELSPFILGSTYQNDNFIQTDTMTNVEIQNEAQELYDQALEVLAKVSQPRYEFSLDAVNFTALEEFQTFIDQLELGTIVTLELKTGTYVYPVLLGMDLNFDDPTDFSLIFGNRLRLDDSSFTFSDLVGNAISSGITTSFNSEQWGSWGTNYKDDVSTFITSSLDAAVNNVISGSSQNVLIDSSGIRVRSLDGATYENEQLWINNGIIAFTEDNWNSAKLALGKITNSHGTFYGIVGDYLVGRVVAANELTITNEDNTFTVNGAGATLTDATFTLTTTGGNTKILLNPTAGISIQKNSGGTWVDQFTVDGAGNAIFKGSLSAATGTFTGTLSGATIIGGTISGTTGTFSGNIYANKLFGLVDYSQLTNIPADKITSSTMSGNRIYGGTLGGPGASLGFTSTGLPRLYGSSGVTLATSGNTTEMSGTGTAFYKMIYVIGNIQATGNIYANTSNILATQSMVYSALGSYATQSWANSNFYSYGESPTFGTVTASTYKSNDGYSGGNGTITIREYGGGYMYIYVHDGLISSWT